MEKKIDVSNTTMVRVGKDVLDAVRKEAARDRRTIRETLEHHILSNMAKEAALSLRSKANG